MPVPVENVVPGRCFKDKDQKYRKILLKNENIVTYIYHDHLAWTVKRHFDVDTSFAEACEIETTPQLVAV